MNSHPSNDARIVAKVPAATRAMLERLAAKQHRSIAGQLAHLIEQAAVDEGVHTLDAQGADF